MLKIEGLDIKGLDSDGRILSNRGLQVQQREPASNRIRIQLRLSRLLVRTSKEFM